MARGWRGVLTIEKFLGKKILFFFVSVRKCRQPSGNRFEGVGEIDARYLLTYSAAGCTLVHEYLALIVMEDASSNLQEEVEPQCHP
jgi:hypothetical protein